MKYQIVFCDECECLSQYPDDIDLNDPDDQKYISAKFETDKQDMFFSMMITLIRRPISSWYWVFKDDEIILSGAIDPMDLECVSRTAEYIEEHMTENTRCGKCGAPVLNSDTGDYSYQCMNCDEDLYAIETSENKEPMTEWEYDQLFWQTYDELKLDKED